VCIGLWRAGRGAGWRTVESLAQRLTAQSVAIKLQPLHASRQAPAHAAPSSCTLLTQASVPSVQMGFSKAVSPVPTPPRLSAPSVPAAGGSVCRSGRMQRAFAAPPPGAGRSRQRDAPTAPAPRRGRGRKGDRGAGAEAAETACSRF